MSRFVFGGTNDEPTERDEAWLKAQEQIEATRREKVAASQQEGGKSLYETLQANKAAKQEQFEESIRLRNQFRSLDEDEVEFLDSVLESTRAKEAAVKKQNAEELEAFRKQQEEAERAAKSAGPVSGEDVVETTTTAWTVSKKRKKGREDILGGVKLRKASTGDKASSSNKEVLSSAEAGSSVQTANRTDKQAISSDTLKANAMPASGTRPTESNSPKPASPGPAGSPASGLGLGLGAYSSDED